MFHFHNVLTTQRNLLKDADNTDDNDDDVKQEEEDDSRTFILIDTILHPPVNCTHFKILHKKTP